MTDIVERLREHAEQYVGDMDTDTDVALFAAAYEIEKLRAYNARLVVDACKAADEIERLRTLTLNLPAHVVERLLYDGWSENRDGLGMDPEDYAVCRKAFK